MRLLAAFAAVTLFAYCSERQETKPSPSQKLTGNSSLDCRTLKQAALRADSEIMVQENVNDVVSRRAIKAFTEFANYCHGDSLSPVFMIKTAEVAKAAGNIPQAKLALDKCLDVYPLFSGRPAALFLLAQLYEENNYLHDLGEAKRLYGEIISAYPRSVWAENARGAIRLAGKSDEEIMKELKKNK
jgi:hypothetical protein